MVPAFTALKVVADRLEGSNISVAGQNCSTEVEEGAHTGEVAAKMLRDVGARYVIVGHSERRQHYFETDRMVNKKCQAGLLADLKVILCIGETLSQRDQGIAERVVSGQLSGGLSGLTASDLDRIIVAYEPVWAIGTGRTATPEQAQEMHAFIRRVFADRYSDQAANELRILYGGSVTPANARQLLEGCGMDGFLIGGASLDADGFAAIAGVGTPPGGAP